MQPMKKIHLAIATDNIAKTVEDYSRRLGFEPCLVIPDQYALWRNETVNLSVRQDASCQPGELRHLGWEDPEATEFTASTDVNGVLWENFNAEQQAAEIEAAWPGMSYVPKG
jgi:catechol 2,3-dioxygenase-like lactoylglutathione lyase family enzyme